VNRLDMRYSAPVLVKSARNAEEARPFCAAWRVWLVDFALERVGSGGAIPTNSTVVVPFQNAERRSSSTLQIPATAVKGTRSLPISCALTKASAAGGVGSVAASAPPHFGGARGRQHDLSHTGEVKPIWHE
jgi:hypothetical protein